jgi:hypothetical protein
MLQRKEVVMFELDALVISRRFNHVIREVDEELGKAAFGSRVISKDRGECGISEGFGEALSQGFPGSSIIAKAVSKLAEANELDHRVPYRKKHRTTCLRSLAVCCSTN